MGDYQIFHAEYEIDLQFILTRQNFSQLTKTENVRNLHFYIFII